MARFFYDGLVALNGYLVLNQTVTVLLNEDSQ